MIKLGVNGLGCIGALTFISKKRASVDVATINNLLFVEHLTESLKYHSANSTFNGSMR